MTKQKITILTVDLLNLALKSTEHNAKPRSLLYAKIGTRLSRGIVKRLSLSPPFYSTTTTYLFYII